MRALITGVNGFVGEYLTSYLISEGIAVFGTGIDPDSSLSQIEYRQLDIRDRRKLTEIVDECQPDFVFHLAAQSSAAISWAKPEETISINILGTLNLLETMKASSIKSRILLVGSSEEYGFGERANGTPINEDSHVNPANPYAISKLGATMLGKVYSQAYGMEIVTARAFNHIGPGQSPNFVVSSFAKRIAEIEKKIVEPVIYVGNLEAKRDFTDVRDVVRAYNDLILKGQSGHIYNVGSGKAVSIKHILNELIAMSSAKVRVEIDKEKFRPVDVPMIVCDNRKLVDGINWTPFFKLEDSLTSILNFWRKQYGIEQK